MHKMPERGEEMGYKPGNKKLNLALMEKFDTSRLLPHPMRDATKIYDFVSAFEMAILKQIHQQRVAIHLSGGLDTRTILAVLLKHNIDCDSLTFCNQDDFDLASKLVGYCGNIRHATIFPSRAAMEEHYRDYHGKYNVILSGSGMTELWEYHQYVSKRTKHEGCMYKIPRDMQRIFQSHTNVYYPAFDPDVIEALRQLPNWWRRNKRLQLYIIREFCPGLVEDVPHDMPKLPLFLGILRKKDQRFRHTRYGEDGSKYKVVKYHED
jgi:hypothetical protein